MRKDKLKMTAKVDGKIVDTKTFSIQELTDDVLVFVGNDKKIEFNRAK